MGDLVTECHSIFCRMKNDYCQDWNVHVVCYVRQTVIHTAELLMCEPRTFDFEVSIEKLNKHKSLSNDEIPAEILKA